MSRVVIDQLIRSLITSKHGIKLSLDKLCNNGIDLNITRPAVLRQYFGTQLQSSSNNDKHTRSYTYGLGTGTSSVGMGPYSFVTREMTPGMKYIANELREILCSNMHDFNLVGVDLSK